MTEHDISEWRKSTVTQALLAELVRQREWERNRMAARLLVMTPQQLGYEAGMIDLLQAFIDLIESGLKATEVSEGDAPKVEPMDFDSYQKKRFG